MIFNEEKITPISEDEKLKIVESITKLPERDKYYVLGFIQAKLLDKSKQNDTHEILIA